MNDKVNEQVRQAIADHDAAHQNWRYDSEDGLSREAKETKARAEREHEAKQKAKHQQQLAAAANNTQNWQNWIDARTEQEIEEHFDDLRDAIGELTSQERADRRKETKTACDETKQWVANKFETRLALLEERLKAMPSAEQQAADAQWAGRDRPAPQKHRARDRRASWTRRLARGPTRDRGQAYGTGRTPQISAGQIPGRADVGTRNCGLPRRAHCPSGRALAGPERHGAGSRGCGLGLRRARRPRCGLADDPRHIRCE